MKAQKQNDEINILIKTLENMNIEVRRGYFEHHGGLVKIKDKYVIFLNEYFSVSEKKRLCLEAIKKIGNLSIYIPPKIRQMLGEDNWENGKETKMSKINLGVIGAGVLGTYHIQKCIKNPNIKLIGFYDISNEKSNEVSKKFHIKFFNSLNSILENGDAFIIATPSKTHFEIVRTCLENKKHVLVEKPLAASYKEGEILVDIANKNNLVLNVGHSEAFNSAFAKLTSYNPTPRFIEIHRLAMFSPRGTDVSVIFDLMVHDIHLVLRLLNEEPCYDLICATGVPVLTKDIDIANARIPFPCGCVINCTASRISAKRMRKLRLFEKNHYYSVDLDKEEIECYHLVNNQINNLNNLPIDFTKEKPQHIDALEAEQNAFINDIFNKNKNYGVSGQEALKVIKIAEKIIEIIGKNKII
jgi:predicted dehydrogenase